MQLVKQLLVCLCYWLIGKCQKIIDWADPVEHEFPFGGAMAVSNIGLSDTEVRKSLVGFLSPEEIQARDDAYNSLIEDLSRYNAGQQIKYPTDPISAQPTFRPEDYLIGKDAIMEDFEHGSKAYKKVLEEGFRKK